MAPRTCDMWVNAPRPVMSPIAHSRSTPLHPHALVDGDRRPGVLVEADGVEADAADVGRAARGDEDLVGVDGRCRRRASRRPAARHARRRLDADAGVDVDALALEHLGSSSLDSGSSGGEDADRAPRRRSPSTPKRANACASSSPIAPPPSTIIECRQLRSLRRRGWSTGATSASPGIGGIGRRRCRCRATTPRAATYDVVADRDPARRRRARRCPRTKRAALADRSDRRRPGRSSRRSPRRGCGRRRAL